MTKHLVSIILLRNETALAYFYGKTIYVKMQLEHFMVSWLDTQLSIFSTTQNAAMNYKALFSNTSLVISI